MFQAGGCRGIEVARISPKRIHDIFQIRAMLEPQILKDGVRKINMEWLTGIRKEFIRHSENGFDLSAQDIIELSTLDNEFHMGIVNSIDNHYITELMMGFQDYLTLFRACTTIDLIRFGPSNREHIIIVDSILKGDIEEACRNLTEHLNRSYEESISIVMQMPI
ncbi:hypothetical protein MASR2M70_20970 [Bacillota bacterium]